MSVIVFGVVNLLFAVLFVYMAGRMASRRGRAVRPWMWAAVIFWPVAIPVLAMLPKKQI
jgi:hypothetical protein